MRPIDLRATLPRDDLAHHAMRCLSIAAIGGTRALAIAGLAFAAAVGALLLFFRFVDPPGSMLMFGQSLSGGSVTQQWVPLEKISPQLVRAVIMSEDGNFCRHRGVDLAEMREALKQSAREGDDLVRGASTISMQTAKNLFLWPGRTYLRKALEITITIGMEVLWPKKRILEVYLNIAEWGPGVFGAEAAARHHFRKPASRLVEREAALLAAALPNPIVRSAGKAGPGTRRLAQTIEGRMRSIGRRDDCILRQS